MLATACMKYEDLYLEKFVFIQCTLLVTEELDPKEGNLWWDVEKRSYLERHLHQSSLNLRYCPIDNHRFLFQRTKISHEKSTQACPMNMLGFLIPDCFFAHVKKNACLCNSQHMRGLFNQNF